MHKIVFFLGAVLAIIPAAGQVCEHTNLSKSLLFKTELTHIPRDSSLDSYRVKITLVNKRSQRPVFTTAFSSTYLFSRAYTESNATRSYTTGAGRNREEWDYDYGDLIVADFNFDGKEDFAAKNDSGGNRGPTYNFYLQNAAGSFVLNTFLTERMGHFPNRMNKAARTLTLESERWNYRYEAAYRLDAKTGKWREIKYEPRQIIPGLRITE